MASLDGDVVLGVWGELANVGSGSRIDVLICLC